MSKSMTKSKTSHCKGKGKCNPQTFYVDSELGNDETGNGTISFPFKTIGRTLINGTYKNGDTIQLAAGTYPSVDGDYKNCGFSLPFDSITSLKIVGNGIDNSKIVCTDEAFIISRPSVSSKRSKLKAKGKDFIHIESMVFSMLTIVRSGSIGPLFIGESTKFVLTSISSSTPKDMSNDCQTCGGIIQISASILELNSVVMKGNQAGKGGVVCALDGSKITSKSSFYDQNNAYCTQTSIPNSGFGGTFYLESSTFESDGDFSAENTATRFGGFLFSNTSESTTIKSGLFSAGVSQIGSGIYVEHARKTVVENSTFAFMNAVLGAGSIFSLSDQFIVRNCSFITSYVVLSSAAATPKAGGAIYSVSKIVLIENSYFDNNIVTAGPLHKGGAIFAKDSEKITIENCNFVGCGAHSNGQGGSVNIISSKLVLIRNSTFDESATSGSDPNEGGSIYVESEQFEVVQSRFENGYCGGDNGQGGAIKAIVSDQIIIRQSAFVHFNLGGSTSTGAHLHATSNNLFIEDSEFVDGLAQGQYVKGGGIFCNISNELVVENSYFYSNEGSGYEANGGAVFALTNKGSFRNCNFTNNLLQGNSANGGAIHIDANEINIEKCTFVSNLISGTIAKGGAILATGSDGNFKISQTLFDQNSAITSGGAIHVNGFDLTLTKTTISNNVADSGGAIYFNSTIENELTSDCETMIFGNQASNLGGKKIIVIS